MIGQYWNNNSAHPVISLYLQDPAKQNQVLIFREMISATRSWMTLNNARKNVYWSQDVLVRFDSFKCCSCYLTGIAKLEGAPSIRSFNYAEEMRAGILLKTLFQSFCCNGGATSNIVSKIKTQQIIKHKSSYELSI